jgi:hypothetical protein
LIRRTWGDSSPCERARRTPFFHIGYVEDNAGYTVRGLPHDVPIGCGEGNRRILRDALENLPMTPSHYAADSVIERMLIDRHPNHEGLIRTLGWFERVSLPRTR